MTLGRGNPASTRKGALTAVFAAFLMLSMTLLTAAPAAADCPWLDGNVEGCTPPPEGMVSWWTFDAVNSASVAEDHIGSNHGLPEGDPARAAGMVANAWWFDSDGDMARAPHDLSLNAGFGSLSIDAWVHTRGFEGYQTIVDKRGVVDVETIPVPVGADLDEFIEQHEDLGYLVREVDTSVGQAIEVVKPVEEFADLLIDDIDNNVPSTGPQLRGYHFFIEHGTLKFQLNTAGLTSTYTSGHNLGDGAWHHVAVTVDRDADHGVFYVDGSPVSVFSTATQVGSVDNFANAVLGRFQAYSSISDEWGLDEVELFHRVLEDGEIGQLYEAGAAGKCKVDCENPEIVTYRLDSDLTTKPTHPTVDPRPGFKTAMTYPWFRDVDHGGVNKMFVHSFQNLPDDIMEAKLTIRLRGEGSGLNYNDAIGLQYTGLQPKYEWYSRIGSTATVDGLTPDRLGYGDTHTFVLNLDALPKTGDSLIDDMNDAGHLDIMVQDDTSIDYIELKLLVCDCSLQPADEVVQAGVEDDFDPNANHPEVPTPLPPAFATRVEECHWGPTMRFDETGVNRCFGHTLTFEPRCLEYAVLEIRLRVLISGAPYRAENDGIALQWDAATDSFAWRSGLVHLPESGGSWQTKGQTATFFIDIGDVAPDLLQDMATTGTLDVHVWDDTSVDYMRLHLKDCCGGEGERVQDGPL